MRTHENEVFQFADLLDPDMLARLLLLAHRCIAVGLDLGFGTQIAEIRMVTSRQPMTGWAGAAGYTRSWGFAQHAGCGRLRKGVLANTGRPRQQQRMRNARVRSPKPLPDGVVPY